MLQIAKPVVQNRFMKGLVTSGVSVSVANVATMPMGMLQHVRTLQLLKNLI